MLLEKRCDLCQHFIEQGAGKCIDLTPAPLRYVENAGLIATDEAGGLDAGNRYRKSDSPRKATAVGDRQNHGFK